MNISERLDGLCAKAAHRMAHGNKTNGPARMKPSFDGTKASSEPVIAIPRMTTMTIKALLVFNLSANRSRKFMDTSWGAGKHPGILQNSTAPRKGFGGDALKTCRYESN
jgi:hypothetical protein